MTFDEDALITALAAQRSRYLICEFQRGHKPNRWLVGREQKDCLFAALLEWIQQRLPDADQVEPSLMYDTTRQTYYAPRIACFQDGQLIDVDESNQFSFKSQI